MLDYAELFKEKREAALNVTLDVYQSIFYPHADFIGLLKTKRHFNPKKRGLVFKSTRIELQETNEAFIY